MTDEEKAAKSLVVNATIKRLIETYADFIEKYPGYDRIPDFFQDHLYSPPNKEARDAALDSLYEKLKSVTGPEMTENIHQLILLNKLTDDLDLATAKHLLEGDLKGKSPEELESYELSIEQLNDAVQYVGRFEERKQQMSMVGDSLNFFFSLSKLPLIKLVMAPIKVAASLVGASELVTTMEAGYNLSRNIKDMKPFVDAFQEREFALLDRLAAAAK